VGRCGWGGTVGVMDLDDHDARPRLRGLIHAAVVPLAVVGAWFLVHSAHPGDGRRESVLVFGTFLVLLFAVSALYHAPRWNPRVRKILSRADVATIQLFIAATMTPLAVHALDGGWRRWTLVVAWVVGIVGAALAASPITAPRWLTASAYVGVGWLAVVPLVRLTQILPWEAVALFAVGGILYTLGAVVYARRRPDPWPRWFGFHEVFHVLVVAAGAVHYLAIWRYALPLG
jgi:hemolysin III